MSGEDLYNICIQNGFGMGFNKSQALKHFTLAAAQLNKDEKVLLTFIGLHNLVSMSKHEYNYAYILTDKRILMAQKKLIGENIQTILWDNLNDITLSTSTLFAKLTFDTFKEKFNVGSGDKKAIKNVYTKVNEIFHELKANHNKNNVVQQPKSDPYEDVKKAKELLDLGIISQAEFDQKKKELLHL